MSKLNINEKGISTVEVLLVLVIVALVVVIGLMVYNRRVKTSPTTTAANISTTSQPSGETSGSTAINTVINKGDYHGLAALMSDRVKVIKEGTDAGGSYYSSTAAAATISNFYSQSNTSQGAELPWDFTGHSDYRASAKKSTGAVKEYIPQGHIAVSKNDWVLGYNLNSDQKISSFYVSGSVNLSK